MWPPIDQLTVDGYDMQFGTNVVGKYVAFVGGFYLPILSSTKATSSLRSSSFPLSNQAHRTCPTTIPALSRRPRTADTSASYDTRLSATTLRVPRSERRRCIFKASSCVFYPFTHSTTLTEIDQANAVIAHEASRRYADKRIVSLSVHPGKTFSLEHECRFNSRRYYQY